MMLTSAGRPGVEARSGFRSRRSRPGRWSRSTLPIELPIRRADRSHACRSTGGVGRHRCRRDVDLVALADLADLGVVDRGVDDVGVGADHHDLGARELLPVPSRCCSTPVPELAALLEPVPALPPEPDPVPVTCWPTVRSTEATVPAIVEVSDASFRFVCAVDSDDSAEVTDAWSESIVLVEAPD